MGRDAIQDKLIPKLHQTIRNESQVVYIFVELGKLLEHANGKKKYSIVNFYRDWVVHTKLERSSIADKVVRYFDDAHRAINEPELIENPPSLREGILGLVGYTPLRMQLEECLKHFGLPAILCQTEAAFSRFMRQLGRVVEDSPLLINKQAKHTIATEYVESVSVTPLRNRQELIFDWIPNFHKEPANKLLPFRMIFPVKDYIAHPRPPKL